MRYTVLTYIFGDYECVHEVEEKDPEADYVLVTDRNELHSDTWRIVLDDMPGMTAMEKCYFVRFHPFHYAKTELCIRLDASIAIHKSLGMFIDKMEDGDYDRCLMVHPFRDSVFMEYSEWARRKGYPPKQAERCTDVIKRLGYKEGYRGLFQMSFEVVRDNRVNDDINEIAYRLLRYVALDDTIDRIDQTMTSFVINHLYCDKLKVLPVSQDIICQSPLMQWYSHKSYTKQRRWRVKVPPMMFDRQCETWNPA